MSSSRTRSHTRAGAAVGAEEHPAAVTPAPAAAPTPATAASRAARPKVGLLHVHDHDKKDVEYHIYGRYRAPVLNLTVVRRPTTSSSSETETSFGWIKSCQVTLDASAQPSSLSGNLKIQWSERINRWLDGLQPEKHAVTIRDIPNIQRNDGADAGADHNDDDAKHDPSSSSNPLLSRSELRLTYKNQTLIRLILVQHSTKRLETFGLYRESGTHLMRHIEDLLNAHVSRLIEKTTRSETLRSELKIRLNHLDDVGRRKMFLEEGLYAWSQQLLKTKDEELKRLDDEYVQLENELKVRQMKKDLGEEDGIDDDGENEDDDPDGTLVSDSLGLRIPKRSKLTEADLMALATPVDEENESGDSDKGEGRESDEDEDEKKISDTKSKSKKSKTSVPKKTKKVAPKKRTTTPAVAPADESSSSPAPSRKSRTTKATASRKKATEKVKKKKADSDEEEEDEEDHGEGEDDGDGEDGAAAAESAHRTRPKRTRKRIRSPSPHPLTDDDDFDLHDDAADGTYVDVASVPSIPSDSDSTAAAIAAVTAFEAGSIEPPLPAGRTRPRSLHGRPSTPHASPKEESDGHQTDDNDMLITTTQPLLPLTNIPAATMDEHRRKKRRAASPPPRVLPKKSLAEILRAGAAGLDGSEMEESSQ